jgi:hypothetical protein
MEHYGVLFAAKAIMCAEILAKPDVIVTASTIGESHANMCGSVVYLNKRHF